MSNSKEVYQKGCSAEARKDWTETVEYYRKAEELGSSETIKRLQEMYY